MEILGMKNTIAKIKMVLNGINSTLDIEDKINELEDIAKETIQNEGQREKH